MILFYHLDEWVVGCAEAVVAYGREVGDFGARAVDVGLWACGRHSCIVIVVGGGQVLVVVEGRKERGGVAVVVVVAGVLLLLRALCQALDKKKEMTVAALPAY